MCVIRAGMLVELILEVISQLFVLAKVNEMRSRLDKDLKVIGDRMTDVKLRYDDLDSRKSIVTR